MSLLAAPTPPANAARRMANAARISSNVQETPIPVLWGTRNLSGDIVAWTNLSYDSGGATGKGGGIVSAGDRYYRTFAIRFCLGPADTINYIRYDNQTIWTGPVSIASALASANAIQGAGSVLLEDNPPSASTPGIDPIPVNNNRGTICFYFGTETQTQDPFLAQFIDNAPFYRGMVYAVFHGPRTVTGGSYSKRGFRIGSADQLCQLEVNITRMPPAPAGGAFSIQTNAPAQPISISATGTYNGGFDDVNGYGISLLPGADNAHLSATIQWTSVGGDSHSATVEIQNGVAFDLIAGFSSKQATISWPSSSSPPLNPGTGTGFTVTYPSGGGIVCAPAEQIGLAANLSGWTGRSGLQYELLISAGSDDSHLDVAIGILAGTDTGSTVTVQNGVAFAVGTLGLMVTLSWPSDTAPISGGGMVAYQVVLSSQAGTAANGGANIGAMVYELLSSTVAGFALNPAIIDVNQFAAFAAQANFAGLNYMTTEKADARGLIQDILKNVQGSLVLSNGLIAPRLMGYLPGQSFSIALTLEADDVVGCKVRPGAWYELPAHVNVKYRDEGRLYLDSPLSLPGAGSVGNDQPPIDIDLPMATDMATARLIGLRMKALETLPKKPDTLICGRGAFPVQFGDIIALNSPMLGTLPASFGYQPGAPLVVLAVREHGTGDGLIELDVAPDVFGYLPVVSTGTGGSPGGPPGPATPFKSITAQDAFEFPYDWDPAVQRLFCLFAARTDPDAQQFSLWRSDENPPVDYTEADADALFCAGGTITGYTAPRFTMDRQAVIQFSASSQDIDTWQSVSDTEWFAYQFLVVLGGSGLALIFAAENLEYLGSNQWQITGLWGPLFDTIGGSRGADIWVFALQPPYDFPAIPAEVIGVTVNLKGIPFGSRLSPTLAQAIAAQVTVAGRSACPRAVQNPNANGWGPLFNPTYGSAGTSPASDIALAWDLCNRQSGMGVETNPCEFDPAVETEVGACQVDVVVGGTVVNTYTATTREEVSTTVAAGTITQSSFPLTSATGIQPGDRISVVDGHGGEWFGRVATIVSGQCNLVSPLPILPVAGYAVNRYEACGLVYTAAMNLADNTALPASVTFNIYSYLNGLRSLQPATITVTKL